MFSSRLASAPSHLEVLFRWGRSRTAFIKEHLFDGVLLVDELSGCGWGALAEVLQCLLAERLVPSRCGAPCGLGIRRDEHHVLPLSKAPLAVYPVVIGGCILRLARRRDHRGPVRPDDAGTREARERSGSSSTPSSRVLIPNGPTLLAVSTLDVAIALLPVTDPRSVGFDRAVG
jgi:hypothetical protein